MQLSSDGDVIAVASSAERASGIAQAAVRAGFPAKASVDLGWALDERPKVLVVAPAGWEGTVRALLSGFEDRTHPPPAVILVGNNSHLPHTTGPVLKLVVDPPNPSALGDAITIAMTKWENFAAVWPEQLNTKRSDDVARIERLLECRTGLSVRSDRRQIFNNALRERMIATLATSIHDYETLLTHDTGELELLACRTVIGETHFWRYSGQMNALKALVRDLALKKAPDEPFRIWCAGSSTGEEPYSVAMATLEQLGDGANVLTWGTDIHPVSLSAAKEGVYNDRSMRNLPDRLKARWFDPVGSAHRVNEELRHRVLFGKLNLCGGTTRAWAAEHGPFDAIFCRNVLIYFSPEKSKDLIRLFADSLKPGGGLFLGSSETLFPAPPDLKVYHAPGAFYYTKAEAEPEEEERVARPTAAARPAPVDIRIIEAYDKGLEALGREDHQLAEELFDWILERDPIDPRGNTGRAILLSNQGREVEARACLEGVVGRGKALAETYFMLGLLDERAARPQEALEHYTQALALNPDFFMAHFNRAWIYKRQSDMAGFKNEMRMALAILKTNPRHPAWVTGGLRLEAILGLVAEAVEGGD